MNKRKRSDGILVFDRYYSRKPKAFALILQRILFCSVLSAASMLYIFSQYELPISLFFVGGITALCTALLSALFVFVGRRYVIPALGIIFAPIIYFNFDAFWLRFSYFVDAAMMLVDGRILHPKPYLIHKEYMLTSANSLYREGVMLGGFILCALYAILCAGSMKKRVRTFPALAGFMVLWIPSLFAEKLEINVWFIVASIFFAAAAAIELNYKDGLAVTGAGAVSYKQQLKEEERSFLKATGKAKLFKRIGMRFSFYSKYFASGIFCAAIFGVCFIIGMTVFGEKSCIDYSSFYELFTADAEIGDDNTGAPDNVTGDFFSSPSKPSEGLNITNPGRGNESIIKVTFTGDKNIYLRGDIGVDFNGTSWSTPLKNEKWNYGSLNNVYRPAEAHVLNAVLDVLDLRDDVNGIVTSDITIEYIKQTDIVFLPSYTADFSYYDSPYFDVYGDFCVRLSDSADRFINSVQCTALIHDFSGSGRYTEEEAVEQIIKTYSYNNVTVDDLYQSVIPEMTENNVFSRYTDFVEDSYLWTRSVPEEIHSELIAFMRENDLLSLTSLRYDLSYESHFRYVAAQTICDFLTENYKYSLSGENKGEGALMQFLTETKRGHCSLFATAMTLMLRELKIPARYCTGFSIYPDSVLGNTVTLKQKNLHAWVEVYIDELGWVTFDPTAAAVSAGGSDRPSDDETKESGGTTSKTEEAPDSKPDEETKEDSSSDENESSVPNSDTLSSTSSDVDTSSNDAVDDNKPTFEFPLWVVITGIAVLALILCAALLITHLRRLKNDAEAALKKAPYLNASSVYNCIIELLYYHEACPERGQLPSGYYQRCDELFNAGMTENSSLLEKAAFGNCELDEAEMLRLSDVLCKLYNSMLRKKAPLKRYHTAKIVAALLTK